MYILYKALTSQKQANFQIADVEFCDFTNA